ncbi:hypothetical protein ACHAWU_009402 [Discostella pseudostelligera]|uniref:Alpha-L-glutamate ligase-related protein ATP-grasp domain-containing protein n=1 Tax=Discostella pseudostelligera TaxID=259834 RepID=A0ABD3LWF8_9STRA
MGQAITLPFQLAATTLTFYRGFFYYLAGHGRTSPYLRPSSSDNVNSAATATPAYLRPPPDKSNHPATILFYQNVRIHLYALASEFYLYHKPHYRKSSYRLDLLDNLSNVAIPGTGLSLSYMVINRPTAFFLVCVIYPIVSLLAAIHLYMKTKKEGASMSRIADEYATRLLAPDDWFSLWRLNSKIAALHSYLHNIPEGYTMENKWTFLVEGTKQGVPVSPYLTTPGIVVKHRNEEGGMGIHFYHNACDGGDWIIQERISNGRWVTDHLPKNAPLSTFRVITQSRGALMESTGTKRKGGGEGSGKEVTALSCVFRAGRAGASTDHVAIMFDIDVTTGSVLHGSTNSHWYRLGILTEWFRCPWRSTHVGLTHHPDGNIPLTGEVVPNIREMLSLVEESHAKLCPDVPLVGWDVVCSSDEKLPICLLEVNLSCNFFMGSFDKKVYLDFLEDMIENMQELRLKAEDEERKKVR